MELLTSIQAFLDFVESPPQDQEERRAALARRLDQVAWVRHATHYAFDERNHPDPPTKDYEQHRQDLLTRFPDLGGYNCIEPVQQTLGTASPMLGDALDDLVDITQDFEAFIWRWNHTSEDDAIFHLTILMPHWMGHVRGLQHYLSA